jgi:hypothetical protein
MQHWNLVWLGKYSAFVGYCREPEFISILERPRFQSQPFQAHWLQWNTLLAGNSNSLEDKFSCVFLYTHATQRNIPSNCSTYSKLYNLLCAFFPLQWAPFAKNYHIQLGVHAVKVHQLFCSLCDGFTSGCLFVSGRCIIEPEHQVSS